MAYAAACKAVYPGSIPGVASSVADQAVLVRTNLIRSLGCRPVPADKIWGEFNVTRCWVTVPVPAKCRRVHWCVGEGVNHGWAQALQGRVDGCSGLGGGRLRIRGVVID